MKSKKKAIVLVRNTLEKHISTKFEEEEDIKCNTDLIMEQLYKEIWDMNRENIENELENKKNKEIEEYKSRLEKEYKAKERQSYVKNFSGLLFEGIIVATLVGLGINQITEIIGTIKNSLKSHYGLPVEVSALIVIFFLLVGLALVIGKNFIDKIECIFKEIEDQ
ncbi:hypothetical protein [Paraclostridium sordellii]|uniref:hypothetical protein n=1 Tax=Paraclostridium sordellii TaxID=1505 RepID=UPI0005DE9E93|nr:hypothetical protein [Paeniclostridium sordellii]CEQ20885.1 Uncharacterised protein [[Clostridium] sordellii] [Paeniclostridium sordellii]